MLIPLSAQRSRVARTLIRRLSTFWEMSDLEGELTVQLDTRLTRSLGRCRPAKGVITLHPELARAPNEVFATVLCHEAAHVATFRRFGRSAAPHGVEWKAFVKSAGFSPSRRLAFPSPLTPPNRRSTYEHRCPVCQDVWYARRAMRHWRCPACTTQNLSGHLMIARLAGCHQ
jgi:predicted SprT family Zn-dependent metalloprotease